MLSVESYEQTICFGFLQWAEKQPKRTAVRMGSSEMSYGDLADTAQKVARLLVDNHSEGKRIGIRMQNSLDFLACFYGIVLAKAIAVPLSHEVSDQQLPEIAAHLKIDQVWTAMPDLESDQVRSALELERDENKDVDKVAKEPFRLPALRGDDLFYMAVSSGSTGKPKGILRSHRSWVDSFRQMRQEFHIGESDRLLLPGQLFYSATLISALQALYEGAEVVLLPRFSVQETADMLALPDITTAFMVPTMLAKLLARFEQKGIQPPFRTLPFTCITAGSKLEMSTKQKWLTYFPNCRLYEYYGAAELSFVSILKPDEQLRVPNSVGRAFAGVDIIIRDEQGVPTGQGQIGEVYIASSMVAQGYGHLGAEAFLTPVDGSYSVGDMGYVDEEGYLYITGRKQDLIIRGGVNIFPAEVEEAFAESPYFAKVVVFGVPDQVLGESIVAACLPRERHAAMELAEIEKKGREWLTGRLPLWKQPDHYWQLDALPLGSTGKIDRARIKRMFLAEQREDGEHGS